MRSVSVPMVTGSIWRRVHTHVTTTETAWRSPSLVHVRDLNATDWERSANQQRINILENKHKWPLARTRPWWIVHWMKEREEESSSRDPSHRFSVSLAAIFLKRFLPYLDVWEVSAVRLDNFGGLVKIPPRGPMYGKVNQSASSVDGQSEVDFRPGDGCLFSAGKNDESASISESRHLQTYEDFPQQSRDLFVNRAKLSGSGLGHSGSAVSRSLFQSGGWRFNPWTGRCVLEQGTWPWVASCSCSTVTWWKSLWIKASAKCRMM